MKILYICN